MKSDDKEQSWLPISMMAVYIPRRRVANCTSTSDVGAGSISDQPRFVCYRTLKNVDQFLLNMEEAF